MLDLYPLLVPHVLNKKVVCFKTVDYDADNGQEKNNEVYCNFIDYLILNLSASNGITRILIESILSRCTGCSIIAVENPVNPTAPAAKPNNSNVENSTQNKAQQGT